MTFPRCAKNFRGNPFGVQTMNASSGVQRLAGKIDNSYTRKYLEIMSTADIPLEKKVNLIYQYLFDTDNSEAEEQFWNSLSQTEQSKIAAIQQENFTEFIV